MTTETIAFNASDDIVKFLIKSQAGSIEKAVMELVMNSIDAKATEINIVLSATGLTIFDNGCGFASKDEILENFRTFGFDHTTKDQMQKGRAYGKFGLGRGQIFAFGRSKWKTNEFQMDVDIENDDKPAFDLTVHDKVLHKGCTIEVEYYEPLTLLARENIKREIRSSITYVPVDVYIDGLPVNTDVTTESWTEETEDFYFKVKPNSQSGVEVYNQGVFVRFYSHHHMGVSGVLVSKTGSNFELNMSRNDVLQSSCKLWKKALKLINAHADKQASKKKSLSDGDRESILMKAICGNYVEGFERKDLFPIVTGRYVSLAKIKSWAGSVVSVANRGFSQAGESAHKSRTATVLDPQIRDWLQVQTDDEVVTILNQFGSNINRYYCPTITLMPFSELEAVFESGYEVIANKDLTTMEKCQIAAVQVVSHKLASALNYSLELFGRDSLSHRKIVVGKAKSCQAWTDGSTYIAINKEYLKRSFNNGVAGISQIINVLLHEYCHNSASNDDHAHPPEFYERFEDIACGYGFDNTTLTLDVLAAYTRQRRKHNLPANKKLYGTVDRLIKVLQEAAEGDIVPDEVEEPVVTPVVEVKPNDPDIAQSSLF